ncbi:MAG: HEAT repeat domain-containing protein [Candidatus Lokiarchaeota archaeon]|nr:HEAT repeat domain-containing protein [Candidatus Lokiarchaeota archaeon]
MGSDATRAKIEARAAVRWRAARLPVDPAAAPIAHATICRFLDEEYAGLPEKERVGKGAVFICRPAAASLAAYFRERDPGQATQPARVIAFAAALHGVPDTRPRPFGKYIAVFFLAEFTKLSPDWFAACEPLILAWASSPDWEAREMALEPLLHAVRRYPEAVLPRCREWLRSPDENVRRFVAEGLRPRAGTRWLRDPARNAPVLAILRELRHDPAEYVRKSVGNNLKDLSKYMPGAVLDLAAGWIRDEGIRVAPDLASRSKADLGAGAFALVWILKQGLRWLRDRSPGLHGRIAAILGDDFVRYFDEKKNRGARPGADSD